MAIEELSLWDENARFSEEYFNKQEPELIEYFLKKKDFKLEAFAKEIFKEFDLPQLEKLVVLRLNGRLIVLEGNRRLTIYKLLTNPALAKNAEARKIFDELSKGIKIPKPFYLEAVVTSIKEEGLRFVDRKHNRGNNEVGWGEPERRNFAIRRSHGKSKDVLRVELANAVKKLALPEAIKEAVLSKGLVTTFYRIVDSAPASKKLGYVVLENGTIKVKDQKKFDDFLKVIVFNIWSKKDFKGENIDSRSLNKADAIEKYIRGIQSKEISKVDNEIKKSTKENLFGEKVILTPSRTKSRQLSAMRNYLINSSMYIKDSRINDIYDELRKKLEVENTPNAVAVLFRVFMECSIDYYIDNNSIKVKNDTKLAGKILKVVDHIEDAVALRRLNEEGIKSPTDSEFKKAKEKVKFSNMRRVATKDNNSILSIETFHEFVHDYKSTPIPSELKKYWDNLDSFFCALWSSLSNKKNSMSKYYSPLRYPGGKQKLTNFLARVCKKNHIKSHYIEPYAGGAAVALYLLIEGSVSKITINDKDRSIYAFWYSVLNHTDELCDLIIKTQINIRNWRIQKEVQLRKDCAPLLELGFSTFFLNRTNRSGIINGGPIGGLKQDGEYKIDCRFNKKRLVAFIRKIAEFKNSIHVYNLDALELVKKIEATQVGEKNIFYFDPPYYLKGESLYLNSYIHKDHKEVARTIKSIKNAHWIVTYDNTLPIRKLYKSYRSKKYTLQHTANISKTGKEVMFISNSLLAPKMVFA